MNASRREIIRRAVLALTATKTDLEAARDEEQNFLDAMPEPFQRSDKFACGQEHVDALDAIIEAIEEFESHEL